MKMNFLIINEKGPSDRDITFNRMRAFNDKEEELLKLGKTPQEAHDGASRHLWDLEHTDPRNYLRKKDRKAAKKAKSSAQQTGGK
jgi:hypothetical protein